MDTPSPEAWIGNEFRILRKTRRLSQAEVVRRMRAFGYTWSQATMTRIEHGSRPMPLNEIADLAALYEVRLTTLLAGVPERELTCSTCGNKPAEGFTCNACGRSGG